MSHNFHAPSRKRIFPYFLQRQLFNSLKTFIFFLWDFFCVKASGYQLKSLDTDVVKGNAMQKKKVKLLLAQKFREKENKAEINGSKKKEQSTEDEQKRWEISTLFIKKIKSSSLLQDHLMAATVIAAGAVCGAAYALLN